MGRKLKRKNVYQEHNISHINYCPLGDVISDLEKLREEHGEDCTLAIDSHGYDGFDMMVHYYRPETDAEYEKRCKAHELQKLKEKERKEKKEATEKKEYERLKKKFG